MKYRIEYTDGNCCNFVHSRKDLLEWLKLLKDETITDIRKVYKSGATDSVIEKYKKIYRKIKKRGRGVIPDLLLCLCDLVFSP